MKILDGNFPWLFIGVVCLGMIAVTVIHRTSQGAVERSQARGCTHIAMMLVVLGALLLSMFIYCVVILGVPAMAGGFTPMRLDSLGNIGLIVLGVAMVAVVLVKCSE